jgi:hypothetical protein
MTEQQKIAEIFSGLSRDSLPEKDLLALCKKQKQ